MLIDAKFASRCPECSCQILPGAKCAKVIAYAAGEAEGQS